MAHAAVVAQTDCCHYNVIEVGVDVENLVCIVVGFGCVDMPDWLCLKIKKFLKHAKKLKLYVNDIENFEIMKLILIYAK